MTAMADQSQIKRTKEPIRIPADIILVAIGQDIESEQFEEHGISTKWNRIVTDAGGNTTGKMVYSPVGTVCQDRQP